MALWLVLCGKACLQCQHTRQHDIAEEVVVGVELLMQGMTHIQIRKLDIVCIYHAYRLC